MTDKIFLLRYTPQDSVKNLSQAIDNHEIYRFKDGNPSERVFKAFSYEIHKLLVNDKTNWVIAFIPASSANKTKQRYSELVKRLKGCNMPVRPDAIFNKKDRPSSMITGKTFEPDNTFGIESTIMKGKNVLLIDDVYTRGTTYENLRARLLKAGARQIYGMFLGVTSYSSEENPCDPPEWKTTISSEELELHQYCYFGDKYDKFTSLHKCENYGIDKRVLASTE